MAVCIVVCMIVGYLFGCIQTGYIVGRVNKIDIRDYGSGNSGTTNTGEKGVAIPHTDVSHVNKKGIAIATLKQPVEFVEMGTDDEYVNAQVIFMLAVDEKGHLELLQAILAVLQDQEVLKKLIKAKDAKEIIENIKEKENI